MGRAGRPGIALAILAVPFDTQTVAAAAAYRARPLREAFLSMALGTHGAGVAALRAMLAQGAISACAR
ncbi:hypothetical protein [Mesorhizobium sp. LNHC229A00]|uniref:hypothetical protein n=1 Tax=Mesorhizobium sp. LNHC229A00 TaxID=1287240 RepID=UPI0003CEC545|nr:hypothetical protein [Mesorhizobium sp. LNHC229A00]ESY90025.1 hypothetical protein X741_28690 [Mesorhizobium sp. LNHC229A00]